MHNAVPYHYLTMRTQSGYTWLWLVRGADLSNEFDTIIHRILQMSYIGEGLQSQVREGSTVTAHFYS